MTFYASAHDKLLHFGRTFELAKKLESERLKVVNLDATVNIDKSRNKNQPIIFASTISNYGSVETGFCTEDTPLPLMV